MNSYLSLRQLRAFEAVAAEGSFTRAAQRLFLTQSALSVLIRDIEKELGVALFDRHTRRVELTEAGHAFLPDVRRMLNELSEAVGRIGDLRDKRKGVLRLAASQLIASTLLPVVLAAYRSRFEGVDIRLRDTLPEHLLTHLQSGEVELLLGPDGLLDEVGLRRHPVFKDKHWLVCRTDDALRKKASLRWPDLEGRQFVAPTRDFVGRLRAELGTHCEPLLARPSIDTSYFTTALGLVSAGMGVTLCPTYSQQLVRSYGLEMLPLQEPSLHREVSLYSLPDRELSPAAQGFIDCVDEVIRGGNFIAAMTAVQRQRPTRSAAR